MKAQISKRDLKKLVAKMFVTTRDESDEELRSLLDHVYPTLEVQNA